MKVTCTQYPELDVADIGVHFRGGVAEVSEVSAAALKQMEGFGFVFDELVEVEASTEMPAADSKNESPEDVAAETEIATTEEPAKPNRGAGK